jgi:hypothetical protein
MQKKEPFTIKHPQADIEIPQSLANNFDLLQTSMQPHIGNSHITLADYPITLVHTLFGLAQHKCLLLSYDNPKPLIELLDYIRPNDTTKNTIYTSLITSYAKDWAKLFNLFSWTIKLPAYNQSLIQTFVTLPEETQQQFLDFLYEKKFDTPLFKEHTIRDYTKDLQTWSATNKAYLLYDHISKARGEIDFNSVESVSLHNCHKKLDLMQHCFKRSRWTDWVNIFKLTSSKLTRLHLPLLEKCLSTLIAQKKEDIGTLAYIHIESKTHAIRTLYNADIEALHAPCFYRDLVTQGTHYNNRSKPANYFWYLFSETKFSLGCNFAGELPIEKLQKLPKRIELYIDKIPTNKNLDTLLTEKDTKYTYYYIFPQHWRIKTIATWLILCCLCYKIHTYSNRANVALLKIIDDKFSSQIQKEIFDNIQSISTKHALYYHLYNTMQWSTIRKKFIQAYIIVENAIRGTQSIQDIRDSIADVSIPVQSLDKACLLINKLCSIGYYWQHARSCCPGNWMANTIAGTLGFFSIGPWLLSNTLGLIWPSWAIPQCTIIISNTAQEE